MRAGGNPISALTVFRNPYVSLLAGRQRTSGSRYHIVREHGTRDWCLILTAAGRGVASDGHRTVRADHGTLLLYPPETFEDYRTDPETGRWDIVWIHFHPPVEWLPLMAWPDAGGCEPPGQGLRTLDLRSYPSATRRRIVLRINEAVDLAVQNDPVKDLFAMNHLENAFLHAYRRPKASLFAEDLRVHVLRNLQGGDLSRTALASFCHLSLSSFFRRFVAEFGMPPQAYVEHCRMDLARSLFALDPPSIKHVALMVGYANPLYFSRRFRRFFGVAPETVLKAAGRAAAGRAADTPPAETLKS